MKIPKYINMYRTYRNTNVIYVAIIVALLSFECSRNTDVPGELIGTWKTAAPKYADRHITFDQYYVTLGQGTAGESSYIIREIEGKKENSGTSYKFHYEDSEGEEWILAFYYEPSNDGLIILKNNDNVWKKIKSGE
jgi:hypothetical protein